jgi:hypothetical protein
MNEKIMRLAVQAGFLVGDLELFPETIERFAELVRADEREVCAIALETGVDFKGIETEPLLFKLCLDVVSGCVTVIRARGEK